jgi:flagellar hook-associated protein 2
MRVAGLASGMDIDAMVKKMMDARRIPMEKLQKQSLKIDYRQEAYRSVSTAMVDLRNNKLSNLSFTNALGMKKATITGDASAVKVSADGNSASGVYQVEVTQLATAATVKLQTQIKSDAGNPEQHKKALASLGSAWTVGAESAIKIGDTSISYDASVDTLESLISKINANKEANVTALYNSATGELSITSKTVGERELVIGGDLAPNTTVVNGSKKNGENAKAIVNGIALESSNNQLNLNGASIQLLKETEANKPITVSLTTDTDKVVENIKTFITEYNKVLELINTKLGEEKFRNYDPLTDAQRESLSDKQAELWDQKARSGLLKNDSILSQTVSDLRRAIISGFGPAANNFNIQSLGISTGNWTEGGKLVIEDEALLRQKIESDPEAVAELFSARTDTDPPTNYSKVDNPNSGIFSRINDVLADSLKLLFDKAGTSQVSTSLTVSFMENSLLSEEKRSLNSRISDMNRRLADLEVRYYKQFSAMESAINKYNSQASSLSSFMN